METTSAKIIGLVIIIATLSYMLVFLCHLVKDINEVGLIKRCISEKLGGESTKGQSIKTTKG